VAYGRVIGTLDGDGQNDPADLPALLSELEAAATGVAMVAGWRTQRKDSAVKLLSSRIANAVRRALLKDGTPDTGCGIKVLYRDVFRSLPYFGHMHRFLPALVQRAGETPATYARYVQVWRLEPLVGRHRGFAGRLLADPPLETSGYPRNEPRSFR